MESKSKFEVKEKIVRAGNSRVFQSWHEHTGVDMETFIEGLRWLCDDPMPDGKMSRELGSVDKPPYIIRLDRRYGQEGLCAFYEHDTHRLWSGSSAGKGRISISVRDKI